VGRRNSLRDCVFRRDAAEAALSLYRNAFGFGGVTLTLICSVYVLGNLASLLFFARLSDQIGRRAVTLPAIGIAMKSTADISVRRRDLLALCRARIERPIDRSRSRGADSVDCRA
jgi:hypothetical protein